MAHFTWKIHQLRGFFIVYTVARLAVEIILGWGISRRMPEEGYYHYLQRWLTSPSVLLPMIIMITAAILALGLWLFHHVLKKKNWARILLLVIGWLTVIDAVTSLLFASQISNLISWATRVTPDLDWSRIILIDRIKDILGLIFWGYLLVVLQFDPRIKREFISTSDQDA